MIFEFLVLLGGLIGLIVLIVRSRRIASAQVAHNLRSLQQGGVIDYGAQSSFQLSGIYGWFFKLMLVFATILFPTVASLLIAVRLNAALDQSSSRQVPVDQVQHLMTTTNFILRDYKIEYQRESRRGSFHSTPLEIMPLIEADKATLHEREGAFGWSWTEKITVQE